MLHRPFCSLFHDLQKGMVFSICKTGQAVFSLVGIRTTEKGMHAMTTEAELILPYSMTSILGCAAGHGQRGQRAAKTGAGAAAAAAGAAA